VRRVKRDLRPMSSRSARRWGMPIDRIRCDYCLGLLMPIERKSVEPIAAVTASAQGHGRSVPTQGQDAGDDRFPNQARDRLGANQSGPRGRAAQGVVLTDAGYGNGATVGNSCR
jgi:SRSO17 transposase